MDDVRQVYFDHAATTPTRPEVIAAMLPYLEHRWGNPSSLHATGVRALEGIERAREHLARFLHASADEVVFTGSGTEADNHALLGVAHALGHRGDHIITSAIEHHAVLHTAAHLESLGLRITYLPVDGTGLVDPDAVRAALTDRTILVSIMHANNEIGTLQPIAEIGATCRARGVLFHTDAVQTVGHVPIDVHDMNIDLLSLSAHKLYGPKGIGALFIREGAAISSYVHGGGQERSRRASTENVAGIVALGEAARLAGEEMEQESAHASALRGRIIHGLLDRVPDLILTGHPTRRLPNSASFCVPGIEGEALLLDRSIQTRICCDNGSPPGCRSRRPLPGCGACSSWFASLDRPLLGELHRKSQQLPWADRLLNPGIGRDPRVVCRSLRGELEAGCGAYPRQDDDRYVLCLRRGAQPVGEPHTRVGLLHHQVEHNQVEVL